MFFFFSVLIRSKRPRIQPKGIYFSNSDSDRQDFLQFLEDEEKANVEYDTAALKALLKLAGGQDISEEANYDKYIDELANKGKMAAFWKKMKTGFEKFGTTMKKAGVTAGKAIKTAVMKYTPKILSVVVKEKKNDVGPAVLAMLVQQPEFSEYSEDADTKKALDVTQDENEDYPDEVLENSIWKRLKKGFAGFSKLVDAVGKKVGETVIKYSPEVLNITFDEKVDIRDIEKKVFEMLASKPELSQFFSKVASKNDLLSELGEDDLELLANLNEDDLETLAILDEDEDEDEGEDKGSWDDLASRAKSFLERSKGKKSFKDDKLEGEEPEEEKPKKKKSKKFTKKSKDIEDSDLEDDDSQQLPKEKKAAPKQEKEGKKVSKSPGKKSSEDDEIEKELKKELKEMKEEKGEKKKTTKKPVQLDEDDLELLAGLDANELEELAELDLDDDSLSDQLTKQQRQKLKSVLAVIKQQ